MRGDVLAARFLDAASVATDGNSDALGCLNAAIDASGVQRKVLAADCGLSESQFSRLTSGVQGFPLTLLDKLPASIRRDWLDRMAAREQHDLLALAAEQLSIAAIRWLRVAGTVKRRMAKAGI